MKHLLIILALILCSCEQADSTKQQAQEPIDIPPRIRFIDGNKNLFLYYQIIEVDGVEYLTSSEGGICPLIKNP